MGADKGGCPVSDFPAILRKERKKCERKNCTNYYVPAINESDNMVTHGEDKREGVNNV